MDRLIAEDLLLLLLDDEKGTTPGGVDVTTALGGGVLVELALIGSVEVEERSSAWTSAKVHVTAGPKPDDPVLADSLGRIAQKTRSAQDLVSRLGKGVKDTLLDRLTADGLVRREEGRVLGLFPRTTWPVLNASHESDVRRELTRVLVEGAEPDPRTAGLVALLRAVDQTHKVVPHEGIPHRVIKARAKEISEGAWAAKAVSDAIAAATAAMVAVMVASTAATSAGSGS